MFRRCRAVVSGCKSATYDDCALILGLTTPILILASFLLHNSPEQKCRAFGLSTDGAITALPTRCIVIPEINK